MVIVASTLEFLKEIANSEITTTPVLLYILYASAKLFFNNKDGIFTKFLNSIRTMQEDIRKELHALTITIDNQNKTSDKLERLLDEVIKQNNTMLAKHDQILSRINHSHN